MSQTFSFQSHQIRTIIENGQPWFVGRDLALLLGYTRTEKEIRRICKHVKLLKHTNLVGLKIPTRGLLVIPEPDVWRLILRSTLPKAQEVEEWIMSEVLPSIRKTGKYEAKPEPNPLPTEFADPGHAALKYIRECERKLQEHATLSPEDRALLDELKKERAKPAPQALPKREPKALPPAPQPTYRERCLDVTTRMLRLRGDIAAVTFEMMSVFRNPFWGPGIPEHKKPFAEAMNYAIQAVTLSLDKELEAAGRLFEAYVESEKLMNG